VQQRSAEVRKHQEGEARRQEYAEQITEQELANRHAGMVGDLESLFPREGTGVWNKYATPNRNLSLHRELVHKAVFN
jgi:hypothetical protein